MKGLTISLSICCALFAVASCQKKVPTPPPPPKVIVTTPVVQDVPVWLQYIGNLVPNISVQIMGQVSGILTEQHFVEGQDVKQGDLLLVIDPRPYEAALLKAEAQLEQTIASLDYAKETTQRYAKLVEQDFISQLNYDSYVTNVLSDQAIIEQNKADIATAKINLGYCYITAPMDGVTGLLQIKPGNYVNASADSVLTVLNQIQPCLVNFYVPETDLYTIQKKQREQPVKIEVFLDSAHTVSYEGTLTLIDNQVNSGTGAILMQGTLPNEDKLLWPGNFVDVRVHIDEKKGALLLPTPAVLVGQSGHYVYVVNANSEIEMKPVQIGQRHEELTVVYSGITVNDKVVTEGQLNLYPGLKVAITTQALETPADTQQNP
ncbi:MAG: efflux RND transporter periplasmic adaptor subunit [Rhabdochlamydiaceae bacterium]|nr:efflux RND transporter periplasmic adaptor subunit [Rhabdochlamydiaceae bacterium]